MSKEKEWKIDYDKDVDHLFVGVYPMKKDAMKYKMNDLSLYIDKNGDICGIFIEYYKSDFKKNWKKIVKKLNNLKT